MSAALHAAVTRNSKTWSTSATVAVSRDYRFGLLAVLFIELTTQRFKDPTHGLQLGLFDRPV